MDNSSPATVIDRRAKAIFSCDAQTSGTLPARLYYYSTPTKSDLAHMDFWRDMQWPQDREATEQQQAGIRSKGYRQGRLLADSERSWWSEEGTHHFDNLLWQALNGDDYRAELTR